MQPRGYVNKTTIHECKRASFSLGKFRTTEFLQLCICRLRKTHVRVRTEVAWAPSLTHVRPRRHRCCRLHFLGGALPRSSCLVRARVLVLPLLGLALPGLASILGQAGRAPQRIPCPATIPNDI